MKAGSTSHASTKQATSTTESEQAWKRTNKIITNHKVQIYHVVEGKHKAQAGT